MARIAGMTEEQVAEHAAWVRQIGYTHSRTAPTSGRGSSSCRGLRARVRGPPRRNPHRAQPGVQCGTIYSCPLNPLFISPAFTAIPASLAIVRRLLGDDAEMVQYATDTPAKGSVYQEWHGDVPPLFPEEPGHVPPPAIITMNFAMVDVSEDNGPFEVADGTHLLPRPEALERIEKGDVPLRKLLLKVGDVLIRDPRCLHRGTPNTTDTPRPVAVFAFERAGIG